MACGGIYSIRHHYSGRADFWSRALTHACYQCHRDVERDADLFVEEWDSYLHRACLIDFLCAPAGQTVIQHQHAIQVPEAKHGPEGECRAERPRAFTDDTGPLAGVVGVASTTQPPRRRRAADYAELHG